MSKFKQIQEGKAKIQIPSEEKISKKLPVFYNPVMQSNRDMTLAFLKAWKKENLKIADLMAGSGIRAIRFLKELKENKIKELVINDANPNAINLIEKNLELNQIPITEKIRLSNQTVDSLLSERGPYDYIDIDPFGSPNQFLDTAIKRLIKGSALAVTATDTAPLCGTYPKACRRKYWADPERSEIMHETATRILIRKVQLIAAQYEKALTPVCSFTIKHYIRVFFKVEQGKAKVDQILKQHGLNNEKGPMWLGQLQDENITSEMLKHANKEIKKTLTILNKEAKINTVGFIDIHKVAKELKLPLPKDEVLFNEIKSNNHKVSKTIFSVKGIRTTATKEEIKKIMKKLV